MPFNGVESFIFTSVFLHNFFFFLKSLDAISSSIYCFINMKKYLLLDMINSNNNLYILRQHHVFFKVTC